MSLYRDRADFEPTLRAAAEQLNVPPIVLEKDYWITQVLRHISEEYPNDFIFKGGTSLSKGYSLINRFSEDLDLLIVPAERGRGTIDKLMKRMAETAAIHIGGEPQSQPYADTGRSRSYIVTYQGLLEETTLISHGVLMEMGVRGGPQPIQPKEIDSLLGSVLKLAGEVDEYDDLLTFQTNLLHPGRTLLEKLSVAHREALRLDEEDARPKPNIGRHFFDIYFLLLDEGVLALLNDRAMVSEVLEDIQHVTDRFFSKQGPSETRPQAGFATSPAFDESSTSSLQLKNSYYATMPELHFGDELPEWADICQLVQDRAALL